ncbi:Glutamate Receptor Ionotropic, Nmda 3A [Manis pentadactyla]|nr:Glutamate Receptor Ionotropic, Nmda 3A [Manis pentadactyla]
MKPEAVDEEQCLFSSIDENVKADTACNLGYRVLLPPVASKSKLQLRLGVSCQSETNIRNREPITAKSSHNKNT